MTRVRIMARGDIVGNLHETADGSNNVIDADGHLISVQNVYNQTLSVLDFETDTEDAVGKLNRYFQKVGYLAIAS